MTSEDKADLLELAMELQDAPDDEIECIVTTMLEILDDKPVTVHEMPNDEFRPIGNKP